MPLMQLAGSSLICGLRGKRFLLVLDDVRGVGSLHWDVLLPSLSNGADGSVVIFTTEYESAAKILPRTYIFYVLEHPPDESCWWIFQNQAFDGRDPSKQPELVEMGKRIAKQCRGQPWVAMVVGNRLRNSYDPEEWIAILQDVILGYLPPLNLPVHLKTCFSYCSLFPKSYLFRREELVQLWMAEDFIESRQGKTLEDIGLEYFDQLLLRSLFQHSKAEDEAFVMHDAIHELALSVSGDEKYTQEGNTMNYVPPCARHVSLVLNDPRLSVQLLCLGISRPLRTFLVIRRLWIEYVVPTEIPHGLFTFLGSLRVLDLSHTCIRELPDSIGNLKHLRYLGLSGTQIKQLPESICNLYRLQTLELVNCKRLQELPKGVSNLVSLRHLNIRNNFLGIRMPRGIGRLGNLQTLPTFNVERDDELCGITELTDMAELRELCIYGVCNSASVDDVKIANLKNKKHLEKLTLMWLPIRMCNPGVDQLGDESWNPHQCVSLFSKQQFCLQHGSTIDMEDEELYGYGPMSDSENICDTMDEDTEDVSLDCVLEDSSSCNMSMRKVEVMDTVDSILVDAEISDEIVLEGLQPHTNIRILEINSYGGITFPSWIGYPGFYNLKILLLEDCHNCKHLLPLGQLPCLEYLGISGMPLKFVGTEFCGSGFRSFPSLKTLSFHNLNKWVKWCGFGKHDFPCLSHVTLFNCPKLQEVPDLLSLVSLEVERCDDLELIPALTSFQSLTLCACDALTSLPPLPSLCDLTVRYCQKLCCLPSLPLLENLWIDDCQQLISIDFWSKSLSTMGWPYYLTCLKSLLVVNCHQLHFSSEEPLLPPIQCSVINGCLALTLQISNNLR